MKRVFLSAAVLGILVAVALVVCGGTAFAKDKDVNPPGPKGGTGTDWENPPGPAGGPGASPNVRGPKPPKSKFCRNHPAHPKCHINPPGPAGGQVLDRLHRHHCRQENRQRRGSMSIRPALRVAQGQAPPTTSLGLCVRGGGSRVSASSRTDSAT